MNYPAPPEATKEVDKFVQIYKTVSAQMKSIEPNISTKEILEVVQLIFDT